MTSRDFCYWLQGYLEIAHSDRNTSESLSPQQVLCIEKHLALAFKHEIDPSHGGPQVQQALNDIHNNPGIPGGAPVMRC